MDTSSCTFCGKSTSEGARLVHGPGLQICEACIRKYQTTPEKPLSGECSFCGQTANEVQALHTTPHSKGKAICGYCVENLAETL